MGVFIKGNRWYIDYYLNGTRKRESVGPVDKITRTIAEKALKARIGEIVQGKFRLEQTKKPVLFNALYEKYLLWAIDNHRSYRRDVTIGKVLNKFFINKEISSITPWQVEKFKSKRKGDGVSPSTINRELTVLKRVFNLGIEWKLTTENPVVGVKFFKIPQEKVRVLSEEEFAKLYRSATDHLKPVLLVAISTGMRKGEILNLQWSDINLIEEYIVVRDSKNYESRIIPMNENLRLELIKLKEKDRDGGYLFCYHDGKPMEYIFRSFGTALKRSGIEKCTFHSLRHTFATRAVMAGVDIVTVQELLGHKTIAMTKRYSHPTPEHKKRAVNLITVDTSLDTSAKFSENTEEEFAGVTLII